MKELDAIVNFYLEDGSNTALMITGPWGCGKTYYLKSKLVPLMSNKEYSKDASMKYRPIEISLFGPKSIEEIKTELFLAWFPPKGKNDKIKIRIEFAKIFTKLVLSKAGISDYYDIVSEIPGNKLTPIRENIVICFDDLERMSSSIKIEEITGFINNLVENLDIRVIIIANDDKIPEESYKHLKEKVIGNIIEFSPNLQDAFNEILSTKFNAFGKYQKFLNDHYDIINEIFFRNSENLRTLTYFLTRFREVYSLTKKENFGNAALREKESQIWKMLLRFGVAISIEYKKGTISLKNDEGIRHGIGDTSLDWLLDNHQRQPENDLGKGKTFKEKFKQAYFENTNFYFFESVYNFFTGGAIFQFKDLVLELNALFNISDGMVLPQYALFSKLHYPEVFGLSYEEHISTLRGILNFCDKGDYELKDYGRIVFAIQQFDNPLRINPATLEVRIIKGMRAGHKNYAFEKDLHYENIGYQRSSGNAVYDAVVKAAIEMNLRIKKESIALRIAKLEQKCYTEFIEFAKETLNLHHDFFKQPVFSRFSAHKFFLFFLKAKTSEKWEIFSFWQ
ncbi:MAG TPA: hypothetical protein VHS96_09450, partial [Bacteroidia bacterium]|nr:hypothetical protein [Bacteroidia bacterium]